MYQLAIFLFKCFEIEVGGKCQFRYEFPLEIATLLPFWWPLLRSKFLFENLNNCENCFYQNQCLEETFTVMYHKTHFFIGNFKVAPSRDKNLTKSPLIIIPGQNYFYKNHCLEETFPVICNKAHFPTKNFKLAPHCNSFFL